MSPSIASAANGRLKHPYLRCQTSRLEGWPGRARKGAKDVLYTANCELEYDLLCSAVQGPGIASGRGPDEQIRLFSRRAQCSVSIVGIDS